MSKRNLNDPNIADIFRRLKRLETNTMLASASVGRGRLRFYDGSVLLIENGALNVTGTATISGTLDVTGVTNLKGQVSVTGPMEISGTTNITGNTNIMGELNVTGPTTLDGLTEIGGDTTITGQLDITGNTTVDGDFKILGNGLFTAGETKIEPTGKATFGDFIIDPSSNKLIESPAGWLFTTGPDSIGLSSSLTSSVNLNSNLAELNYKGESVVRAGPGVISLNATKTDVNGNFKVTGTGEITGDTQLRRYVRVDGLLENTAAPNINRSATGWLWISSSASRFKKDIQPLDLPESLLDIDMVDWVDKGEAERGEPYRRIPGVIAEDVLAQGGRPFTTWNAEGEIQGVDYDRLALAVAQVLKAQMRDLSNRVDQLEEQDA